MTADGFPGVEIVGVRYSGSRLADRDERSVDAYKNSGIFENAGMPVSIVEPAFPEDSRGENPTDNLGVICGSIADAVAAGRREDKAIVMVGGDCSHITGVLGGLQDVHGPTSKVGLIWFDAHGDFNTPSTTLSGMLGGMPVAVAAGLAYPRWREGSHMQAALPTNRILMVDVRDLDIAEEQLIKATDVVIAAPAEGFPGADLKAAVEDFAERCDYLYLHIDSDILDVSLVPNHGTGVTDGPDMEQVKAAIDTVMATGKVVAFAVVSVYGEGEGHEITQQSGIEMVEAGINGFEKYGLPEARVTA